jgi:hypothetical protein
MPGKIIILFFGIIAHVQLQTPEWHRAVLLKGDGDHLAAFVVKADGLVSSTLKEQRTHLEGYRVFSLMSQHLRQSPGGAARTEWKALDDIPSLYRIARSPARDEVFLDKITSPDFAAFFDYSGGRIETVDWVAEKVIYPRSWTGSRCVANVVALTIETTSNIVFGGKDGQIVLKPGAIAMVYDGAAPTAKGDPRDHYEYHFNIVKNPHDVSLPQPANTRCELSVRNPAPAYLAALRAAIGLHPKLAYDQRRTKIRALHSDTFDCTNSHFP